MEQICAFYRSDVVILSLSTLPGKDYLKSCILYTDSGLAAPF